MSHSVSVVGEITYGMNHDLVGWPKRVDFSEHIVSQELKRKKDLSSAADSRDMDGPRLKVAALCRDRIRQTLSDRQLRATGALRSCSLSATIFVTSQESEGRKEALTASKSTDSPTFLFLAVIADSSPKNHQRP